jgi:hypothetical protein
MKDPKSQAFTKRPAQYSESTVSSSPMGGCSERGNYLIESTEELLTDSKSTRTLRRYVSSCFLKFLKFKKFSQHFIKKSKYTLFLNLEQVVIYVFKVKYPDLQWGGDDIK